METLRSFVVGEWHEADHGFRELVDPSTGEPIARASSDGVDFGAVLAHARREGGRAQIVPAQTMESRP
jgi:oxepin-CoA hydrolase/3-oxo-5,6-dehydrosuberyl-CoA semialdehyde dehydrogenase